MRNGLKRNLKIVADSECKKCGGSGLNLNHTYSESYHEVRINITVCPCVHIEVK